jgi:1,2-dihydroxy-3-keto-5-methylthiopentene dioxygenase
MKVYFHDNVDSDQRLPHEGEPATAADLEKLGVYASNIPEQADVDRIAEERGYKNRDEVRLPLLPFPVLIAGGCWGVNFGEGD